MRHHPHKRSGTACVEFAICMPLLVAMVFGVIQVSNMLYLQNALASAAYEAANVCSAPGGNSEKAQARGSAVLAALGAVGATIDISPTIASSTPLGTTITVTCRAKLSQNSAVFAVLGDRNLSARVVTKRL